MVSQFLVSFFLTPTYLFLMNSLHCINGMFCCGWLNFLQHRVLPICTILCHLLSEIQHFQISLFYFISSFSVTLSSTDSTIMDFLRLCYAILVHMKHMPAQPSVLYTMPLFSYTQLFPQLICTLTFLHAKITHLSKYASLIFFLVFTTFLYIIDPCHTIM